MEAIYGEPFALVRVYRLPPKLTNGFCFGGGTPITFHNVDWFEAAISLGQEGLSDVLRGKHWFDPKIPYLVLGDHPVFIFRLDAEEQPKPIG